VTDTTHAASLEGQSRTPPLLGAQEPARARVTTPAQLSPARAIPLASVPIDAWQMLGERAAEPNGYYLPEWALAENTYAARRANARALCSFDEHGALIGLIPHVSALRAYQLPLPALVTADVYPPFTLPLVDRDKTDEALSDMMQQARDSGARSLILRDTSIEGPTLQAFTRVLARTGLEPIVLRAHRRALLDATRDADTLLHEALGSKKLKELRRQRNRLGDIGEVTYKVASTVEDIVPALEVFFQLEASGWKGRRGTALSQNADNLAFIRHAVHDMAARGHCEIVSLYAGTTPVAAAMVLRHLDRAFYLKMGVDERFAKYSPGVQLTLDLTRQMCADPAIASVDSTADPGHPMIDPIWRARLAIGDVLIPLRHNDPFIPVIRAAIALRRAALLPARKAVRLLRKIKDIRQ